MPRGDILDPWPDMTDSICAICFSCDPNYTTSCRHEFHRECLKMWFEREKTCPYCRRQEPIRDLFVCIRDDDLPTFEELVKFAEFEYNEEGLHPIHVCTIEGKMHMLKILIGKVSLSIRTKNDLRETCLHLAAKFGKYDIVGFLIDNNVNVDEVNYNGASALIYAICGGHLEVVKLLWKHATPASYKDLDGCFVTMHAAKEGHLDVVKFLIGEKVGINLGDINGKSALMYAVQMGHFDIVKFLIDQGARIEEKTTDGWSALLIASYYGHLSVFKLLLDLIADTDEDEIKRAWMFTAERGHLEILKLIFEHGVNVNCKDDHGFTALMKSSFNGHFEIVKFLLSHKVDMNCRNGSGETSLMIASNIGHSEIVKELRQHGAQINESMPSLIQACRNGHSNIVKEFTKDAESINDYEKQTLLFLSTDSKQLGVMEVLLDLGANIDARNESGKTVLMLAVESSFYRGIELLLRYGADINETDQAGRTSLMMILETNGSLETIQFLAEHDADLNSKDACGWTPLMHAARHCSYEYVELLLNLGADLCGENGNGKLAMILRSRFGKKPTATLLKGRLSKQK